MKSIAIFVLVFCSQLLPSIAQTKKIGKKQTSSKGSYLLVGTVSAPKGLQKNTYSVTTDFHPQIQLTEDQLIVRSWSDTSLHVFNLTEKNISFAQKLPAPELVDKFGFGFNIVTNGSHIAVSDERGHGNDYVKDYRGSVYLYSKNKGKWTYLKTIRSPNGERFGKQLSITDSLLLVDNSDNSSIPNRERPKKKTAPMLYRLEKNGSWKTVGHLPEGMADQEHNRSFPLLAKDGSLIVAKEKRYETYVPLGNGSYRLIQSLPTQRGFGFSTTTAFGNDYLLTTGDGNGSTPNPTLFLHSRDSQRLSLPTTIKVDQPDMTIISLAMDGDLIAVGLTYRSAPTNISPVAGRVVLYRKDSKLGYKHLQTIYAPDSYRGDKFGTIVMIRNGYMVIVSEAGTVNYGLKKQLSVEKDQKNIDKIKPFGDIYVYRLTQ